MQNKTEMEGFIPMKKSFRRIFLALMCLTLCLALAVSALAEGPLASLFRAASDLAFNTHNVTLNANATFTYDGELFKTLNGDYVQDDGRSFLKIMLDTPKADGSVYTGGYTVIGEGTYAYAIDTYNKGYYTETSTSYTDTLLRKSAQTDSLLNFGALLLELAESQMSGAVTVSEQEAGTRYDVKLEKGQTPEVLNAALSLLALSVARDRYGIVADTQETSSALVWVEDWDALSQSIYKELFGEEMPADFFDRYYGDSGDEFVQLDKQYKEMQRRINELQNEQLLKYKDGVTIIQADGSAKHYATREEYYIANGQQFPQYDDYENTFKAYYKEKTGTELSDDTMNAIYFGANEELSNAYFAMQNEMNDHYIALIKADPKAVSAAVHQDGTYELVYTLGSDQYYGTTKDQILRQMNALELSEAGGFITTDQDGRIVSAEGDVTLMVVDQNGVKHPLSIHAKATADTYGTSAVKAFDPADYNVVDVNTFFRSQYMNEEAAPASGDEAHTAPEEVVFNGKTYQAPQY